VGCSLPVVKNNFELVVLGIIFISVLPIIIEIVRAKLNSEESKGLGR